MNEFEILARPGEEKRLERFIAKSYPDYTKYIGPEGREEFAFVAKGDAQFIIDCVNNGAAFVSRGLYLIKKMKKV